MKYTYRTTGTCSREITFKLEDGIVKNISFQGGCNGNLKGVSSLAEGQNAEDVIKRLEGIKCGFKNTSCPDQLATALKEALKNV
ncbi:MAG: TIGR03905 family TSCPD domain-containing protein [Oscillospiraceae bacterium]|nr:TIGR03905 family TSCPD domain-containing protein [Oscillospiraceae bacterium]